MQRDYTERISTTTAKQTKAGMHAPNEGRATHDEVAIRLTTAAQSES